MTLKKRQIIGYCALGLFGLTAPYVFNDIEFQISVMWVMILFAVTWDIMGGQMGYNSLGNIFFFGAGMYTSAIVQIGLVYDVAQYTSSYGAIKVHFTHQQYFLGLVLGIVAAAFVCAFFACVLSYIVFGLRGPYFAIGTLGVTLSAGELTGAWRYVGGGGGIAMPVFPGGVEYRAEMFYYLCFALAVITFLFVKWLFAGRFGLAANAIRDDEEKAEGMGIHTMRTKMTGFTVAAFFLGMSGAVFGNMIGFIEPLEVAFPSVTFGIFMVVMCLLGGKGTLWGPVVGATLFHAFKEVSWTYMLGWQWVMLGALIIVLVVFFQQGIVGWMQDKWPELFGIEVDEKAIAEALAGPEIDETPQRSEAAG